MQSSEINSFVTVHNRHKEILIMKKYISEEKLKKKEKA
jgi:hypothetical protein